MEQSAQAAVKGLEDEIAEILGDIENMKKELHDLQDNVAPAEAPCLTAQPSLGAPVLLTTENICKQPVNPNDLGQEGSKTSGKSQIGEPKTGPDAAGIAKSSDWPGEPVDSEGGPGWCTHEKCLLKVN